VVVDGIRFDSGKEADRYVQLLLMQRGGDIIGLKLKPRFELTINHVKICDYEADFSYFDKTKMKEIVEDAKGCRTRAYRIKKKLMLALLGIDVKEV
jgi:hypothetical protein